jgi:hypothetical protein
LYFYNNHAQLYQQSIVSLLLELYSATTSESWADCTASARTLPAVSDGQRKQIMRCRAQAQLTGDRAVLELNFPPDRQLGTGLDAWTWPEVR